MIRLCAAFLALPLLAQNVPNSALNSYAEPCAFAQDALAHVLNAPQCPSSVSCADKWLVLGTRNRMEDACATSAVTSARERERGATRGITALSVPSPTPFVAPTSVLRTALSYYTIPADDPRLSTTYSAPNSIQFWAFIATPIPDARLYVWTTRSTSPSLQQGPPYDQIGEYLTGYQLARIPAREVVTDVLTGATNEKAIDGYYIIPIERLKIQINGEWRLDPWMRVTVWVAPPGCFAGTDCGGVELLHRKSLAEIQTIPLYLSGTRVRAVGK